MTPLDLMLRRSAPLRLVIFDCDGVLVDSEPVSNRILAEDLSARGWAMTTDEAIHNFMGTTLRDMHPLIEAKLAKPLPDSWIAEITTQIVDALAHESTAIPGAVAALQAVTALGLPWRVASNSSHEEMRAKFARIGIADLVAGRVLSHTDVAAGKPAPDLYLAAAAAGGVSPSECVVIEDSVPGVLAAIAAGMDCLGFAPHSDGAHLRAAGAVPFHAMAELAGLIQAARRRAA